MIMRAIFSIQLAWRTRIPKILAYLSGEDKLFFCPSLFVITGTVDTAISFSLVAELFEIVRTRWGRFVLLWDKGDPRPSEEDPKLPDILRSLFRWVDSMLKFGLKRDLPSRMPETPNNITIKNDE